LFRLINLEIQKLLAYSFRDSMSFALLILIHLLSWPIS